VYVGDDEVLLDDSVRFVERAVAAGVDARLDVHSDELVLFSVADDLDGKAWSMDSLGAWEASQHPTRLFNSLVSF